MRVYAYAALCGMTHLGLKLNRRVDGVVVKVIAPSPEPAPQELNVTITQALITDPPPTPPEKPKERRSLLSRYTK